MMGDSRYPRCELFPMKRTFSESCSMGPTQFVLDQDFGSSFQQRHLDLQLSTGYSCDDDVFDCEEVNLSLSIGMSTNKRSKSSRKSSKNTNVYPSSQVIIDLEESTESGSNEFLKNAVSLHQDYLKIDPYCKKRESFNQGSNGWHDVKLKILMAIDLNKDLPDESSFHSNEPVGPYPSSDGSYGEYCSQITTSQVPTSKQPKSQTSGKNSQTKIYTIDLESLPEPSSDLTEEQEDSNNLVENAARSLIAISLQRTTSNQDSEKNSNEFKKKTIIRSSSVDSYESLVLKLEESGIEEDSATSKAFEINEFDQKKNGIKLRRGRRLKDFQKDILPTLSSLSKHEIWEDIKLLEGVIKSREYKRLHKAKTGKGENWFTPVKNKRSIVNYVGQKCSLRKKK